MSLVIRPVTLCPSTTIAVRACSRYLKPASGCRGPSAQVRPKREDITRSWAVFEQLERAAWNESRETLLDILDILNSHSTAETDGSYPGQRPAVVRVAGHLVLDGTQAAGIAGTALAAGEDAG